jgi:hypothetical protein
MTLGPHEARLHQPLCHLGRLLGGEFDRDRAGVLQKVLSLARDTPQQRRTSRVGEERLARLVGELGRKRRCLLVGEVGRIRHDQIESLALQRLEAIAAEKPHAVLHTQLCSILPGYGQSRLGDVGGRDAHLGSLAGEGQRDRAGAGAQVEDARLGFGIGQQAEGDLDQRLGLRARHKHVGRHAQKQRPELPASGEQRDRNPLIGAPPHEFAKARALFCQNRLLELEIQP